MKNRLYLLLLLISPVLGAQPPVASGTTGYRPAAEAKVLLLPVWLRYEDIHTDAPLDPAGHKGAETAAVFDSLAQLNLRHSDIRVALTDPTDSLQRRISAETKNLLRPVLSPGQRASVAEAAQAAGCRYVLVCSLRVKVGPGGYWDPNSGAIGSDASYARFHAALLDPESADGKPCWTQDVELRKLPRPNSERFAAAVHLLFQLLK